MKLLFCLLRNVFLFKVSECLSSINLRAFIAVSPEVAQGEFSIKRRMLFSRSENVSSARFVEIRWYNIERNVSLALYDRVPKKHNVSKHLLRITPRADHSSGHYLTKYRLPELEFARQSKLSGKCMFYWIAMLDSSFQLSGYDCFRGFPFWMQQSKRQLSSVEVRRAFIPGTHNSGTYRYYQPHRSQSYVTQFVECQDECVFNQLFFGARYIELRVAFCPQRRVRRESGAHTSNPAAFGGAAEFWSYHGSFSTLGSIRQIAQDVRDFLDQTHEIVLLDLHKFKIKGNWFRSVHLQLELWQLLVEILGEYMAPFKPDITFGEMWTSNKRLIVSSVYPTMHNVTDCVWPSPLHLWPNAEHLSQLERFFDERLCAQVRSSARITVTKGQLTPKLNFRMLSNVLRNEGGVRYFTPEVNRKIDTWLYGKWACANVVAVDYLLTSNVVRIAIQVNEMRAATGNRFAAHCGVNERRCRRPQRSSNTSLSVATRWRARDEL